MPAAQHPTTPSLQRASTQSENPFASLVPDQHIAIVPSFTLESDVVLYNVPVAYSIRGRLNSERNNVLVICHALSGSSDVADWWGPLMGRRGRAFDVSRFFIICLNSLGSPYGTASPVTYIDGDPTKGRYGPEFPLTTIRDDVNLHKIVLDDLGVRQVAAVVGGSMGGMLVLEYAYFGPYVRAIVPIATSAQHSAWGISWGEAQRQSIYSDPMYHDGWYNFDRPPASGLGAARMQALLTYRSRNSFETRFGRNVPDPSKAQKIREQQQQPRPTTPNNAHFAIHNDGHKISGAPRPQTPPTLPTTANHSDFIDPQFHGTTPLPPPTPPTPLPERKAVTTTYFSAQSYLRYQAQKFISRFDSNCYIAITRKLDTHDVSKHALPLPSSSPPSLSSTLASPQLQHQQQFPSPTAAALAQIQQPALVLGIESDGLFTFAEQQDLATYIPDARLRKIDSPEGHDAFLLQFEQVNGFIVDFFNEVLGDLMGAEAVDGGEEDGGRVEMENGEGGVEGRGGGVGKMEKSSTFGEAEVGDITAW